MGRKTSHRRSKAEGGRGKAATRTRHACDFCRFRKVKCDGSQPCPKCVASSLECTYNPAKKAKCKDWNYFQNLEVQLQNARFLLSSIVGESELSQLLDAPSIEDKGVLADRMCFLVKTSTLDSGSRQSFSDQSALASCEENDELLGTMLDPEGLFLIGEHGKCEYQGQHSGLVLARWIGEQCSQLLEVDHCLTVPIRSSMQTSLLTEEPLRKRSFALPSRARATSLADTAFDHAFVLTSFIHRPTFVDSVNDLYARKAEKEIWEFASLTRLSLLESVLAIGCLFDTGNAGRTSDPYGEDILSEAERHFQNAKDFLDITDCQTIESLQVMLCMAMYLQASYRMSSCHTILSTALSTAAKMGLHRAAKTSVLDATIRETRKRVFWSLVTLETYLGGMLGFHVDTFGNTTTQELPSEIKPEPLLQQDQLGAQPDCLLEAFRSHIRLIQILAKVVKQVQVVSERSGKDGTYSVSYSGLLEVERELSAWFAQLPQQPPPGIPITRDFIRSSLLLRLAYAHVQIVLYRPFLHLFLERRSGSQVNLRAFACASACISACMQVAWVAQRLANHGLVHGSHWFTVHSLFFAVICLLLFVLSNPNDVTAPDASSAAQAGFAILEELASTNMSAQRCVKELRPLLDKMKPLLDKMMALHW